MKYIQKYGRNFDDVNFRSDYTEYKQNTIEIKCFISLFPKKESLRAIDAKVYNTLLPNRIRPEIEKILRKNRHLQFQILTIRQIVEGVRAKIFEATLLIVDFS